MALIPHQHLTSLLCLCGAASALLLPPQSSADDLRIPDVIAFLDRIENQHRSAFGRPKRYSVNEKNEILELRLGRIKFVDGDFTAIAKLSKLQSLDLSSTNVSDSQLGRISQLENLKSLNLFGTSISDVGLNKLRMKVLIESLDIGRTKITDNGLKVCKTLPNLVFIGLHGTKVSAAGLTHLSELKKIQSIKLGDTQIEDSAIADLLKIKSLRGVTLDKTQITQEGLERLATANAINWIDEPRSAVDELVGRIEKSDGRGIEMMTSIGLEFPQQGKFKKSRILPLQQTEKDKKTRRHRYDLELSWEVEGRKPTMLEAKIGVDRGAITVYQLGIK